MEDSSESECDDCPVENVSWDDIQEFIIKLNEYSMNDQFMGKGTYIACLQKQNGNTLPGLAVKKLLPPEK